MDWTIVLSNISNTAIMHDTPVQGQTAGWVVVIPYPGHLEQFFNPSIVSLKKSIKCIKTEPDPTK